MSVAAKHHILAAIATCTTPRYPNTARKRAALSFNAQLPTSELAIPTALILGITTPGYATNERLLLPLPPAPSHSFRSDLRAPCSTGWHSTCEIAFGCIFWRCIERCEREVIATTSQVTITQLVAGPQGLRISEQERYMELRLPWLHVKSCLHTGLRS